MKTKTELLKTARSQVPEVTPSELAKELRGRRPVVLDVREKEETDQGILPGSKQVPRRYLELRIEEAVPDRDADVVPSEIISQITQLPSLWHSRPPWSG